MLTPKIILYKHKTYSDGSHPIIIQVIINGKAVRKVIARCQPNEWLKTKNRVSSKNLMYIQINDAIDDSLRNFGIEKGQSFKDFFQKHIDVAKERGQYGVYTINKRVRDQIFAFDPKIDFDRIDEKFINAFGAHIIKTNKKNTVRTKMQHLGRILKDAVREGLLEKNPMQYIFFKKEKTMKSKLTLHELKKIIDLELTGKLAEVRDLFLACVYMRGVRVGDALSLMDNNLKDDRIFYKESKTGKLVNIAIVPELQEIFDRYKGKSKFGFVFDHIKVPKDKLTDNFFKKGEITRVICRVNYYLGKIATLAEIDKKITSHSARHFFSILARLTIQDTSITKDLVGHSTLAIHEVYISEISDNIVLDDYAKSVLDKLK